MIALLLVGSAIAAFVVDSDGDGIDVGQGTTTTSTTAATPTTSTPAGDTTTTTAAGTGPGGGPSGPAGQNGNGMTTDGSGEMAGPGVIADTGGEALLGPATALLAAGLLLRSRRHRRT